MFAANYVSTFIDARAFAERVKRSNAIRRRYESRLRRRESLARRASLAEVRRLALLDRLPPRAAPSFPPLARARCSVPRAFSCYQGEH